MFSPSTGREVGKKKIIEANTVQITAHRLTAVEYLPMCHGARLEAVPEEFAHDGDNVGPVEGDGGDVEDTRNSGVVTETDQVDGNAPKDGEPDSVQGGTGR
jgi:hypothetical protein